MRCGYLCVDYSVSRVSLVAMGGRLLKEFGMGLLVFVILNGDILTGLLMNEKFVSYAMTWSLLGT